MFSKRLIERDRFCCELEAARRFDPRLIFVLFVCCETFRQNKADPRIVGSSRKGRTRRFLTFRANARRQNSRMQWSHTKAGSSTSLQLLTISASRTYLAAPRRLTQPLKNRLTSQWAHRTAATPASDDLRVHRTQASFLSSRLTRLIAAPRPRVTYAANLTTRCWPASHKLHRQRLTSTLRTSRPSKIKYSTLFHYTSYVTCA